MSNNRFDLHTERLATTDEKGHRVFLFPEDVKGKWKDLRHKFYWFLISIYLIVPWVHIQGKQAILLDVSAREFSFFGNTLYAHNAPILIFFILIFCFFIALITSLFGRAWCGWACPQTVFIDTLYRKVERFIEGSARERRKLNEQNWDQKKVFKKFIKWTLFLIISMHIAHSFMGYFIGTKKLISISMNSPSENLGLFFFTWLLTITFTLDFGYFREQFCLVACPYGRFQSVLMDENSLVIAYDQKRGEPRRGLAENEGDCINCYHCVKVCPTGIDIRRGNQLECIACTHCIDACDEIMLKLDKPKGLIRFASENELNGKKTQHVRPRNIIYFAVLIAILAGLITQIKNDKVLDLFITRGNKNPYQVINNNTISNHFKLNFTNYQNSSLKIKILNDNKKIKLITPQNPLAIAPGIKRVNVFFRFNPTLLHQGKKKITITVLDQDNKENLLNKELQLVGPLK